MSERNHEALEAALAMLRRPQLTRLARNSSLPKGVTLLLKVAAGQPDALQEAEALTGRPAALLRKAAGFFIEQVLLTRKSDSYRILGADSTASSHELRRHMAFILKWLHPDLVQASGAGRPFDKSALVSLVTAAWENLKTGERRSAYDEALRTEATGSARPAFNGSTACAAKRPSPPPRSARRYRLRPSPYEIEREPFWTRLLLYWGRLK